MPIPGTRSLQSIFLGSPEGETDSNAQRVGVAMLAALATGLDVVALCNPAQWGPTLMWAGACGSVDNGTRASLDLRHVWRTNHSFVSHRRRFYSARGRLCEPLLR